MKFAKRRWPASWLAFLSAWCPQEGAREAPSAGRVSMVLTRSDAGSAFLGQLMYTVPFAVDGCEVQLSM